ncbi:MAG: hypothetical protein ACOYMP_11015 [Nodosilinea sp.]
MAKHIRQSLSIHYQQQASAGSGIPLRSWHYALNDPGARQVNDGNPDPDPYSPPAPPTPHPPLRAVVLASGSMLAAATLWLSPHPTPVIDSQPLTGECIKIEKIENALSRDRLKALLAVETPAPRATLQALLKDPYCVLKPTTDAQGGGTDRVAYPLEFDPHAWLVVIYQGDRYTGYDFRFRP